MKGDSELPLRQARFVVPCQPTNLRHPAPPLSQLAFTPTHAVRPGQGTAGRKITIKANWFKVGVVS